MVVFLGDWLKQIPMAALVAVMIAASNGTFSWDCAQPEEASVVDQHCQWSSPWWSWWPPQPGLRRVLAGVLLAAMFFANKVGHYMAISSSPDEAGEHRSYNVTGQVFFSSADKFVAAFDFAKP
ncbi:hypothetical protein P4200_29865 [Pseudomonas aeruginosa]|nr:hypothetical protein [Pseudomonas aeruginosa]